MRTQARFSPRWPVVLATATCLVSVSAGLGAERSVSGLPEADAAAVAHVLNRIAFGPRPGDIARVQQMGLDAYLDEQLHPDRIDDSALDARLATFQTLTLSSQQLASRYFRPAIEARRRAQRASAAEGARPTGDESSAMMTPNDPSRAGAGQAASTRQTREAIAGQRLVLSELMQAKMLRAVESERQLQEVLTDFWFNHFNVFIGKGQVRQYLTEYERDAIRPHVLGRFRDLLGAVAHSPAMLFYLDNWQSAAPTPPTAQTDLERRLNDSRLSPEQRQRLTDRIARQRQPRGINENYARELMELHTLGVDGGYTQQDVIALARILTGWTIDQPRDGGSFIFRAQLHDDGTKTLLGKTFGPTGQYEGERALDLLASSPATAHHIAYELAQRFVSDEPPAALVERAARTFLDSKGDLRAVVRLIITSPEFLSADAGRAKIKTPLEFVVSAVRATGATVTSALPLVAAMQNLGMPLYGCQPPTGYSMTADTWVNTGALINRMNFAVQLVAGGRIPRTGPAGRGNQGGRQPSAPTRGLAAGRGRGPIQVDLADLAPDASPTSQQHVIDVLLAGEASDATRTTLARAETASDLVALALGSPEFQHR